MASLRSLSPLPLFALVLLPLGGCTRAFLQNEGVYDFIAEDVLRDDCGLVPPSKDMWDGELSI